MEVSTQDELKGETREVLNPEGWTNPPTLKDLKQDMLDAKQSHDTQTGKIKGWLNNLKIEGDAIIKVPVGFSKVQPKLIRKQAEWRYSSLSEPFHSSEDVFSVNPATWEDTEAARQNAMVLNHQFNTKMDKVSFIDEYVRTGVDEGTIIVKLGWDNEEEMQKVKKPNVTYQDNPDMAALHEELHTMMQENPTGYAQEVPEELRLAHEESMRVGRPQEAEITGYDEVEELVTTKNEPTLEICDYRNIIVDPACRGDLSKADFIIHSFPVSISSLKRAGKYQNIDLINVEANSPLADPDHDPENGADPSFQLSDKPRKKMIAYEYWGFWDVNGSDVTVPFICTWVGDVIIQLQENPFPDRKLPFVFIQTLPVRGSLYGEPDGELLIDNQKIIGAITRGMIDIVGRSANGQMGHRKDALDAVNKRKFQQGKDYEYNGNVDPRMAFYMHTFPEIPASAQFILEQQHYDAESMTGVKAFSQSGISGDSLGKIATGIRGALDSAGKRETGMLRRLASGMVKIGRKIISMNGQFLEDEEIIPITNESFVRINRDDLAGNFNLKMSISTTDEDSIKAQELAFMLQTIGNNMDIGIVKLILRDIARLRRMPELAHEIEKFNPTPDPLEVEKQELELEELRAKVREINAKALKAESDAAVNGAKIEGTEAQTRKTHSDADKSDLDFVEQESGVTQERELEKQGEQARGNIALKLVEADIDKDKERESELQKFLGGKNTSN